MKKFISTIIALAMVLSMLPMTIASAAVSEELVSFGRPVILSDGTTGGSLPKMVDGISQSSNVADWINLSGDKFGYIDLGKVYDITKIGIWRRSTEETHGGGEPVEFTLWASENLLEAAPTAETATPLHTQAAGTYTTDLTALSSSVKARYVYFDSTKSQGIHEIMVIAPSVTDSENILAGVSGVDKDGNVIEWLTDGDTVEYYNSIPKDNWFKYDLGAIYDFEYLYCEAGWSGTYHQAGFTLLANTEDNLETATTIVAPYINEHGASINGYKKAIDGNYRYIWVMHDPIGAAYVDDLRIYGYPTTAAQKTIEFENYIDKFAAAYGVTPVTSSSYHVSNEAHADFVDGNIINHTRSEYPGNGKAVYIKGVATTESKTIEIPVKITGDGWYSADAQLGGARTTDGQGGMSHATMTLVDAVGNETYILDRDYQNREVSDWINMRRSAPCNSVYIYGYSGQTNYIKKGDYTLKVTVDPYNDAALLILDYLKLIPVTPTTVAADKTTTIEMESLDVQYGNDKYTNASGGKTLYSTYGIAKSGKANVYNIPVHVTKAGYYNISTVMNKRLSADYSTVSVAVNGNKIYDNTVDGEVQSDMQGGYKDTSGNLTNNYAIHKYTNAVQLPAGENVITMTVESKYSLHRFVADCITIERSISAYISGAEELEFLGAVMQNDGSYSVAFGIEAEKLLTTKSELVMVTEENAYTTDLFGDNSIINWGKGYVDPGDGKLMFAIQIDNIGAEYITVEETEDGEKLTPKFKLYAK